MNDQDLLIFKARPRRGGEPVEPEDRVGEVYQQGNRYNTAEPWNMDQGSNRKLTKKELDERAAASNKLCTWHPWRPAYAACAYCGNPFCFEDLVEENGSYYCLEDVDRIASYQKSYKSSFSLNTGFFAGMLFLIPMLIFIYFRIGDLVASISYMQTLGIIKFVTTLPYVYTSAFPLAGIILSFFGILSGVMVLLDTKRSGPTALSFGLLMAIFFSYQYAINPFFYNLGIASISTAAFLLLLTSKLTYRAEPSELLRHEHTEVPLNMPNVGRF